MIRKFQHILEHYFSSPAHFAMLIMCSLKSIADACRSPLKSPNDFRFIKVERFMNNLQRLVGGFSAKADALLIKVYLISSRVLAYLGDSKLTFGQKTFL